MGSVMSLRKVHRKIAETYHKEYQETNDYKTPVGYDFTCNGEKSLPRRMQKLIACKVLKNKKKLSLSFNSIMLYKAKCLVRWVSWFKPEVC